MYRISFGSLVMTTLLVTACGGDAPSVEQRAAAAADPCAALTPPADQSVLDMRPEEFSAYVRALRERCVAASCRAFDAAVRDADAAAVERAIDDLSTGIGDSDDAPSRASSCAQAENLRHARDAVRRVGAAARSIPPRWGDVADAADAVASIPSELRPFVSELDAAGEAFRQCQDAAVAEYETAQRAAAWEEALAATELAQRCAVAVSAEHRLGGVLIAAMEETRLLAEFCASAERAANADTPEAVIASINDALTRAEALPAGEIGSNDRGRLSRARDAAEREAARCERQVDLHDRCTDRCAEASYRHADEWFDRCLEYCDQRAPLCADRRGAPGRPQSGVLVELPAACTRRSSSSSPPPATAAPTIRGRARVARREVSASDFE